MILAGKPFFRAFAFLILAIFSLSATKPQTLLGKWKEYWGVGQKTDVEYNDIYLVKKKGANYVIQCETHPEQTIENIKYKKGKLTFDLINNAKTIPYVLKMSKNGRELNGTAVSVRGETRKIRWTRLEKD